MDDNKNSNQSEMNPSEWSYAGCLPMVYVF